LSSNRSFRAFAIFVFALVIDAVARAGAPITVIPVVVPDLPEISAPQVRMPPPPVDLTAFDGKPVHAVTVVQEHDPWDDIKPPILHKVHLGDPFRADMARSALTEATDTGLYGNARVSIEADDSGGVAIRVHATPRRIIDGLRP